MQCIRCTVIDGPSRCTSDQAVYNSRTAAAVCLRYRGLTDRRPVSNPNWTITHGPDVRAGHSLRLRTVEPLPVNVTDLSGRKLNNAIGPGRWLRRYVHARALVPSNRSRDPWTCPPVYKKNFLVIAI